MASTVVPMHNMGNGYTVVTHVISQPTAPAGTENINGPFKKFLKGEPKALGAIQIIIGLMTILFGIVITVHPNTITVYSGIAFWGSLFYIIAGSLTVAASNKPQRCVVNGSLTLNVFSTISAGTAIILLSLDLTVGPMYGMCYYDSYSCASYNTVVHWTRGVSGVLLVFNLLQFTISISISAFACKATCSTEPSVNIVTLVPNPTANPFPIPNIQQGQYAFSNTIMNCPPAENPPSYNEMKSEPL